MQDRDGSMVMMSGAEHRHLGYFEKKKTVSIGQVFKIRRCYFKIVEIQPNRIAAEGISRKEYYEMKRGRPDWC